ncbi:MAG: DUF4270 family protein [Bacteroidales bacterium]|nr:DUF4270 family protein [Bacteroidales bacterium]
MSSKRSIVFLALLLSSIFVYTSCIETNKGLGGQFVPDDFVLRVHSAEFEIPVTTAAIDSIHGYNTSYMTFGYLNDETFGYASGGFATNISTFGDSTYLGINPELQSIYLYLGIDSISVLNDDQRGIPQNIYIYKLKSDLDSLKLFNKSITPEDYDPTPISVGSPVFFGDDSIKIYLSEEFGRELLATSTAEYDSAALFMERIKGVYFTTDTPELNPGEGRINYCTVGGATIYLKYYLTDPQRGFYRKDTMETYSLGYSHALNTLRTSSGNLKNDQVSEQLPIQSIDGVKPKIKASDIKEILNTWISQNGFSKESVIISRAALEFPYEFDPAKYEDYSRIYPQQIFPCVYNDVEGSINYLMPLPEIYTNASKGNMNRSQNKYTCEITGYIQSLIKKDDISPEKDDLYICPILSYETQSSNSDYYYYMYYGLSSSGEMYYGVDNQNYRHGFLNGNLSAGNKPTLHITYSLVK